MSGEQTENPETGENRSQLGGQVRPEQRARGSAGAGGS